MSTVTMTNGLHREVTVHRERYTADVATTCRSLLAAVAPRNRRGGDIGILFRVIYFRTLQRWTTIVD